MHRKRNFFKKEKNKIKENKRKGEIIDVTFFFFFIGGFLLRLKERNRAKSFLPFFDSPAFF